MSKRIQPGERVIGFRHGALCISRAIGTFLGRDNGLFLVALPKGIVLHCDIIRRAK